MAEYSAPALVDLGSVAEMTQKDIYKVTGSADTVYYNGCPVITGS